jgi:hypothetical protein
METDFVYIHIISFPIFLYYRQYIIALWTATIFTTSYFCWKKNELVNVDKMVARFGIIALNLYTMHPLYTLGTIISVCGYMYGNYVLRTTGKIYPIWWSLNHIIGTALNIYFYTPINVRYDPSMYTTSWKPRLTNFSAANRALCPVLQ